MLDPIKQRTQKNRVRPSTRAYRIFTQVLEARRQELGLPFEQLNDVAGLQDGYAQKMLSPDTPNGRQSRWEMLDLLVEALFGTDFEIEIKPKNYRAPKPWATRAVVAPPNLHWRLRRRFSFVFAEMSRRAAAARASGSRRSSNVKVARSARQLASRPNLTNEMPSWR